MAAQHLNLYLVTFNCGREAVNPEAFGSHLFDGLGATKRDSSTSSPELMVLFLQELAPISLSFLGGSFLAPYFDALESAVSVAAKKHGRAVDDSPSDDADPSQLNYTNISRRNVGLTAVMVFVRQDKLHHISELMSAGVGVGVHAMGNKGAVGVRLTYGDHVGRTSLAFVSAHLAAMEDQLARRNQDYTDIAAGLVFTLDQGVSWSTWAAAGKVTDEGAEDAPLLSASAGESRDVADQDETTDAPSSDAARARSDALGMYSDTHTLFFAGDLNYRTSSRQPSPTDVSTFPQPSADRTDRNHFSHLLSNDQLSAAQTAKQTLHGLHEAANGTGPVTGGRAGVIASSPRCPSSQRGHL